MATTRERLSAIRWKFSLRSLLVLTTCVAVMVVGVRYWRGPTLEQRLWDAACAGDAGTFAWLVWFGADVGVSREGYSASHLQEAALQGNLQAVQLYVQHGAFLDYVEKDGFTPITYAAMESHWDVVDYLLRAGANPHLIDGTGRSALDYARQAGEDSIVQRIGQQSPPGVAPPESEHLQ